MGKYVLYFDNYINESASDQQLIQILKQNFNKALNILTDSLKNVPKIVVSQKEIFSTATAAFDNSAPNLVEGIRSNKDTFNVLINNIIKSFDALIANKLSGIKGWAIKKAVSRSQFDQNAPYAKDQINDVLSQIMQSFLLDSAQQIWSTDPKMANDLYNYKVKCDNYLKSNFEQISNTFINNTRKRLFS